MLGTERGLQGGGHAIIGALTGGMDGAVGAAASSLYMPDFVSFLRANDIPEVLVQAIVLGATGALGSAAGGAAGAAGAYNEAGNNLILAVPAITEALLSAGTVAIAACLSNTKCVSIIGESAAELLSQVVKSTGVGQEGVGPSLPTGLVGTQDSDSGRRGARVNNGALDPGNGGTGNANDDFDLLTGGHSHPAPADSNYPPGTLIGDNGISLRPRTIGSGPRIDIPANGSKPHETLHY